MIKKLAYMDENPSAPSKITLHADWDVLSSLHNALKWFPTVPTLHHVYSHQDDDPTKTELSINLKLNVDADGLDTTALCLLAPKPHMPFIFNAKFQINVQGCTITYNLKPTLYEKL